MSIMGTSESVPPTSEGSSGSLKSSVSTTGTISTWRSSSALSSSCTSLPFCLLEKRSQYSYRLQSSVGFQVNQGTSETDLASEPPQARVSVRRRHQLQSST